MFAAGGLALTHPASSITVPLVQQPALSLQVQLNPATAIPLGGALSESLTH